MDFVAVDYADVDHDGKKELLIQHWAGQYGTALRVVGWDERHEFQDVGSLGTGTTEGFTVGDVDGDGRIEIATVDDDYEREKPRRGASHAEGARVELLYRWDRDKFAVVGRRELPLPSERPRPEPLWHTNPIPLAAAGDSSGEGR